MMAENAPGFLTPNRFELAFGHGLAWLVRVGVVRGHFYVLEVRGRKTGKIFSLPVDPIEVDGRRYLVCARGNSNWVRNARAAGEIALVRAMRRRRYTVEEILPDQRPVILKAYLDQYANEVQRFFPVPKGSAVEAFHDLAPRYPVFSLRPADAKPETATR
jgi:F420H(2)-dependent quinone reductase